MRGKRKASRREVKPPRSPKHHIRIIALRKAWNQVRKGLLYGAYVMALLMTAAACMTEDIEVSLALAIPSVAYWVIFTLVNYKSDKIFR